MKKVLYSCPFVPAEWIASHGLRPSRIMPRLSREGHVLAAAGEGVCPYARAFLQCAGSQPGADAVVMTTTCDQMRRMEEMVSDSCRLPVFLMHVPKTWQTEAAREYYRNELRRMGRFLAGLGGREPSEEELTGTMRDFDAARCRLRGMRGEMLARCFAERAAAFYKEGILPENLTEEGEGKAPNGVPLAMVGGPLLASQLDLYDVIEKAGGRLALDATGDGERTWPRAFDSRRMAAGPFDELADAYFGAIPDAFRRPNTLLYDWLGKEMEERGIKGILFQHHVWCDTWSGEAQRMREWCGRPMLIFETGDEEEADSRTVSQIESFLESLR